MIELRDYLKKWLPEYMVPAAYLLMESLPLAANGKVDRKALPAPDTAAAGEREFVPPRTPVEAEIAAICSGVLRREQVSVHDNFFELGGHSLLAMQVISRIRASLQVELPLRVLFGAPSVAALAERVAEARGQASVSRPPLVPISRDGPLPLSPTRSDSHPSGCVLS